MSDKVKEFDVAIIGGGPGGIFASYFASIKGLKTILIEANSFLGGQPIMLYSQKSIYDYPTSYGIKGYALTKKFVDQLSEHSNTQILLNTKLIDIQKENDRNYFIKLSNDEIIKSTYVIIAIGPGVFKSRQLELPKLENNKKIHYNVQNLSDYENKNLVILGGGDAAVDWANEIATNAKPKSITIVHRRNTFRATGDSVKKLQSNGVNVVLDVLVKEINSQKIVLQNNETKKIVNLAYDSILVQYGQNVELNQGKIFQEFKKDLSNRILVDLEQQTSIPNIYAIGNACIYPNKSITIISAQGEAARAVNSILLKKMQYGK